MNARLLLIEGDADLANDIAAAVVAHGHRLAHVAEARAGLSLALYEGFDLVIVDGGLPELDGLTIVARLRAEGVGTPILFLSPSGDDNECVRSLEAGSDDYLGTPFVPRVLGARVEALLRRTLGRGETILRAGPLELDLIDRRARRLASNIDLLPQEFKLLQYMMRRPNRIITRETLLQEVWGRRFPVHSNLIDVHMGKLRRKIDAILDRPMIFNVRNAGFILRTEE